MHTRHIAALALLTVVTTFTVRPGAQPSVSPHEQLRRAIDAEIVDGDVPAAIEIYSALAQRAEPAHREIAAAALLRLADLFDRLGDRRAAPTYQRVIAQFGDVPAVAALARQQVPQPLAQTRLWSGPPSLQVQAISPDGRLAAFITPDGNVAVHEFATGLDRPVTSGQGADIGAAFSRDGRQVAFQWSGPTSPDGTEPGAQLRIAPVGTSGPGEPRILFQMPDVGFVQPFDWMPDGSAIAAVLIRQDLTTHIALVSTRNGAHTVLKCTDWDRPEGMSLSPDGRYLAFDLPAGDDDRNRDVFVLAVDGSLESRIAPGRSHDQLAGWSSDGRHLLFTSNRTGVSALHAVPMANGAPTGLPVVVKPELGLVRVLAVTADRLFYVVNPIPPPMEVRVGTVDFSAPSLALTPVSGQRLSNQNGPAAWSPDGRLLAYESTERDGAGHTIVIQSIDTDRQVRVLRPRADRAGELTWAPDGRSLLTLSRFKGRYAIARLDADTGDLTTLVANPLGGTLLIRGQSWSADGSRIYYRRRLSNAPHPRRSSNERCRPVTSDNCTGSSAAPTEPSSPRPTVATSRLARAARDRSPQ